MCDQACALCGRIERLTFHHLIPVAVHRKKRYLLRFGKEEMRTRGLMICQLCHSGIHDLFPDEKELADSYNTREALAAEPRMAKHISWVKKQKSSRSAPSLES
jgi:hypothetical protein